jgi:SAM-dependent methyltransferase
MVCHLCASKSLFVFSNYEQFKRITSDCRPWQAGGQLALCEQCGTVQKVVDEGFQETIAEIYATYTMYELAEGQDQQFFDQSSGVSIARSERILRWVNERYPFQYHGRLLDLGSGNGALLRIMSRLMPEWDLAATELTDKYRASIESIPRCEGLYTCPLSEIPGRFDLIIMNNVIEHIINPREMLQEIGQKLKPDGRLLVETVNLAQSPFDLLQADHCSHFTMTSLTGLLMSAGFAVQAAWDDCVPKELTIYVGYDGKQRKIAPANIPSSRQIVTQNLDWLSRFSISARQFRKQGELGIFGTTIAGTWLFAELAGDAAYFVDEDPYKINKTYLDKPVFSPQTLPSGRSVFLALPFPVAKKVSTRLNSIRPDIIWILPPEN